MADCRAHEVYLTGRGVREKFRGNERELFGDPAKHRLAQFAIASLRVDHGVGKLFRITTDQRNCRETRRYAQTTLESLRDDSRLDYLGVPRMAQAALRKVEHSERRFEGRVMAEHIHVG